jgi:hypothetical protein
MFQESIKVSACVGCIALSKRVEVIEWFVYIGLIIALVNQLWKWHKCRQHRKQVKELREKIRSQEI